MSVRLSTKYGVNPTIPVCFWCGEEKNEIAFLGQIGDKRKHEDFEAPKHMVLDYSFCEKCKKNMSLGFTMIEATSAPNLTTSVPMQSGVYPTGRYAVIYPEAAKQLFRPEDVAKGMAFLDPGLYGRLVPSD